MDAIATYNYVELPEQPAIAITPGPPVLFKAVLPTLRRRGGPFSLRMKGEDRWGNPSDLCERTFGLSANLKVGGLPGSVTFEKGRFAETVGNLVVEEEGDLVVQLTDERGAVVARSNPCRIVASAGLLPYWGDLHGQSEETIGTNSARDFFEFARDRAFLDICVHQGNDFQTGLGGDRNVLYMEEGRPLRRSSHALVDDLSDIDSDATSANDLFEAIEEEDCIVFAHVGGRYADIKAAHEDRLERAVEVHSAWGTFEWLFSDAFEQGYRVGIIANSDGHKGRPGASHPGATRFGAYGGLTCVLASELSRAGIMEGLRRRHHYGTTGSRVILDTRVRFDNPAELFRDDPGGQDPSPERVDAAMMGDILRSGDECVTFAIDVHGPSPIERIDIRNGLDTLEVYRPYEEADLGRRIRILWEGSEYRGRGRETIWDGHAELSGNFFKKLSPVNRIAHEDGHFVWSSPIYICR